MNEVSKRGYLVSQPGNINIMTCEVNSIIVFARNLRRAKYNNGENEVKQRILRGPQYYYYKSPLNSKTTKR